MAYLLDTNVFSELRKNERAAPAVTAWFGGVEETEVFLSVIVAGELRRGVELRRRHDPRTAFYLDEWLAGLINRHQSRILPVNLEVADLWGRLCLNQPLPKIDGLLAATALHHDLVLVTRNVADMARSGVRVLNPFGF